MTLVYIHALYVTLETLHACLDIIWVLYYAQFVALDSTMIVDDSLHTFINCIRVLSNDHSIWINYTSDNSHVLFDFIKVLVDGLFIALNSFRVYSDAK